MNPDEEVNMTISKKEYEYLLERSDFLRCLEEAGVDNWEGYEFAQELRGEQSS